MQVGDLVIVRYYGDDIEIGIIVEVGTEWVTGDVLVAWNDGDMGWIAKGNVKVIDEERRQS